MGSQFLLQKNIRGLLFMVLKLTQVASFRCSVQKPVAVAETAFFLCTPLTAATETSHLKPRITTKTTVDGVHYIERRVPIAKFEGRRALSVVGVLAWA